ncbi:Protein of unknown function DUF761 [Macleaya cordata]|uniref:DUF4408 domain-containing protein n=1 Tax=Macleaya cordata TaxID=56857 RepID=A0A200QGQ0_MACCD|nr:Protein of unknown function DUF761 [Macleaya cordata]
MDHIYIEKLQAIKAKNKFKKNQFLNTLIFYCLTALACILLCVSPVWLPSLYSSMKVFLSVSLPNFWTYIFNPKCLFIVCNVIVVFLIGESKLFGSKSSPATEVYNEYVRRSESSIRRLPVLDEKKNTQELKLEFPMMVEGVNCAGGEEVKEEKRREFVGRGEDEEKIRERAVEDFDITEECYLPADEELNRRVENFIARVKKQRKLETGLLVYST